MNLYKLIKDVYSRRELLWLLTVRNLKIRYKNTVLGFLWSLIDPLLLIGIYATFATILRWNKTLPNYFEFLVTGIIVWHFLAICLNDSLHSISGYPSLVKKTAFPRIILPLAMTTANLINFLLTCIILVFFLCLRGIYPSNLAFLPLVIITQWALCLGVALLVCTSNVFFRDTEHIISILGLAWFFLSPVFYQVDLQLEKIPAGLHWAVFMNPMTGLLCAYRKIMMPQMLLSEMQYVAISCLVSWCVLIVGIAVFQKYQVRFADEL